MKRIFAVGLVLISLVGSVALAGPKKHYGADYIFEVENIAVFWAVLKGAQIESNMVYINIAPLKPKTVPYKSYSVEGANAFSGETKVLQDRQQLAEENLIVGKYGEFHTMSERYIHLYTENGKGNEPQLTIYYKGVPDAAPEFRDKSQLDTFFKHSTNMVLQAKTQ